LTNRDIWARELLKRLGLKKGHVCSSDSFDLDQTDQQVIQKHRCVVKEMEAASVAWVSLLMKKPMFAIKGITDTVGSKDGYGQYLKDFKHVTQKLSEKLQSLLVSLSQQMKLDPQVFNCLSHRL
jgi:5'-methylthioadenosine nucleosidase